MAIDFQAKLKKFVATAPKKPDDDPVMVLTIEIPLEANEVPEVARFLGQTVTVRLESPQMAFDFAEVSR